MVLSPWLSSIASWKKPSSSRFKVSPIVHTAPEKENRRRKRSRSLSLDRLQGPHLNLDTTERNHDAGPHSAAKVDHFFAAADMLSNQGVHSRKKQRVRPVCPDHERRDATRYVLLGNIDAHPPRVWSGVACSHHELCGVSRIHSSAGAGVTCNAWIDLAVRRVHSELHHPSPRYAVLDRHLGRNAWF